MAVRGSSQWATGKRRAILCTGAGIIAAWYLILLGSYVFAPRLKQAIRARAVQTLRAEFASDVRFRSLDVSFFPRVHVIARGVLIGNDGARPLIQVATADARSGLLPWSIRTVALEGLYLRIPTVKEPAITRSQPASSFKVAEILADDAHVEILPAAGQGSPIRFQLAHLRVNDFDPSRAAEFSASVISSQPRAEIMASGRLGPWNAGTPSLTQLDGKYAMPRADLSSLPGFKGALSSQGQFRGVLQRIEIAGDAGASQFGLSVSGRPEALRASFHAVVDASDGSASIDRLDGAIEGSSFSANGRVRNVQDDRARNILVNLSMDKGRLEDVLPLVVKSKTSPISGALRVKTKVEILPGEQDILFRLHLDADFTTTNARFSSLDLREQLRDLDRKAAGRPKNAASGSSVSNMQGHLEFKNGVADFSSLLFNLEDASARLTGSYQLGNEQLDFHGQLWMAAKLSQTTTGAKAFLLKAADPFFRGKGGGSQVPIRISGTRSSPTFGVDLAAKK